MSLTGHAPANGHRLVFSTRSYGYLAAALCAQPGLELGHLARQEFPDGEHYRRFLTDVLDRDVVVVGGTISDADTLELYDLASTAALNGAHTITMAIPFFGYSTMERAVKPGEVVGAKTRAKLLSSVPQAGSGNRIVLLDLHSEGIPHYFEEGLRATHLYGKGLVKQACHALAPSGEFVLASTDAGRAKWVESLANDMGVHPAFVFKRRLSGSETAVTAVSAQVEGAHVIVYDDMIRTGGSLMKAAQSYRQAGAKRISAITTHGVFPGDALDQLRSSGLFDQIVATDSHPRAIALQAQHQGFLEVRSIAGLLGEHLRSRR